jgi:hypothetical protein
MVLLAANFGFSGISVFFLLGARSDLDFESTAFFWTGAVGVTVIGFFFLATCSDLDFEYMAFF